jgi:hypothetical protein
MLFGGGGGGGRRKGPDAHVAIEVSLEELYNGGERSARFVCSTCCHIFCTKLSIMTTCTPAARRRWPAVVALRFRAQFGLRLLARVRLLAPACVCASPAASLVM